MTTETPAGLRSSIEITVTPEAMLIAGEIDAANCAILREAISAATYVDDGPIRLDMSRVEFMDSSGIGVLISSFKDYADGVVIVHPSPPVERVLLLTGLYQKFVGGPDF